MALMRSPERGSDAPPQENSSVGGNSATATGHNMQQTTTDDQFSINVASAVKIPPFWKEHPVLWFAQVETAFAVARITSDELRFRHVVLNLDHSALPFVSDLMIRPPTQDKYQTIKTRVINSFDETEETKLRKLLRGQEFPNEKPSNILQRLRSLTSGHCNDTILRTLFMEQLADSVRSILAISEVTDLNKLALQADKIVEMSKVSIAAVTHRKMEEATPSSLTDGGFQELKAMIQSLEK